MRVRIYGAIVVKPIRFPDQLQILIYPLRREDDTRIAGCFPMEEPRSWDWVKNQYPVNPEAEEHIRAGEATQVFGGFLVSEFVDGSEFPAESDVTILDK